MSVSGSNADLCIWHGGCDDGFGAAWAYWTFRERTDDVEFYPGVYQREPPDCADRDVLLVDFSYKRDVMERMAAVASSVTVLDHHATAEADLLPLMENDTIGGVFDMERSGAGLTWDHFHGTRRPRLVDVIEDRDLWRKEIPYCDEVIMALRSYPQAFDCWDALMSRPVEQMVAEGQSIHRYYRTLATEAKRRSRIETIGGYQVPVVNVPHYLASDVAGDLAEGHPFAAAYWDNSDGSRTWSLRSRGDFDVGKFAEDSFGGGGHRNAAGFRGSIEADVAASASARETDW